MMPERASRTFICSVLFLDIVEYSRKPVAEQLRLKDSFNALIATAIQEIPPADRIILDTGDGVAINFLGDPEDALFVAMSLRDAFAPPDVDGPPEVPARIGINLGPVRLVRDLNGRPNIIGDGINVAQRVMGFAGTGQILVSRSYYEIVSHISEAYSRLFSYEGSRTDKHVREHEVYSVGYSTPGDTVRASAGRMRRPAHPAVDRNAASSADARVTRLLRQVERWLGNRSLAYGTAAFSTATFLLALLTSFMSQAPQERPQVRPASTAKTPARATGTQAGKIAYGKPSAAPSDVGGGTQQKGDAGLDQTAPVVAEEQAAPTPERKKRKLRLPFFGSDTDEESATMASEAAPETTAQEQMGTEQPAPSMTGRHVISIQPSAPGEQPSAWTDAPQSASAIADSATVSLAISPWGEVYVDGEHIGVSPPVNEVQVSPGTRIIEIRNGNFRPYTQRVELKARQKIKLRYKFN